MNTQFAIGNTVKFKGEFLRRLGNTQAEYAKRIGKVLEVKRLQGKTQYLKVLWNDGEEKGVLNTNVCKVGKEGIPVDV